MKKRNLDRAHDDFWDYTPWYESRYRMKTFWFTDNDQDGIYRNLLTHYLDQGPLKNNDAWLRALCRNIPVDRWNAWWPGIKEAFFTLGDDGHLHNKRADEVREWQRGVDAAQSRAGAAGAAARWGEKPADPEPPAKSPPISEAVEAYNQAAMRNKWPLCEKFTDARKSRLNARLKDVGGIDGWKAAIEKMEASDFLMGRTKSSDDHSNWKPDFDFLLQEKSMTRLMEGKYDNKRAAARTDGDVSIGKGHNPSEADIKRAITEGLRLSRMGDRDLTS